MQGLNIYKVCGNAAGKDVKFYRNFQIYHDWRGQCAMKGEVWK